MLKNLFRIMLTVIVAGGFLSCGETKVEYQPVPEELTLLVKPFDNDLIVGGQVSFIPRFYYIDETGDKDLQKPVITNMMIELNGEIIFFETNSEADLWLKYDLIEYENGEYPFSVYAAEQSGVVYMYQTNIYVTNVQVLMRVNLKDPLDSEWRQVYISGSSSQLGMVGEEWNPQGQVMDRIDDTTYETAILLGLNERFSYEFTLGNWSLKARREDGNLIHDTVKVTNDGMVVETDVDNWGLIDGDLTATGYVIGFTDDGSELTVSYVHPDETNVTLYYSYDAMEFTAIESTVTQYSHFTIPMEKGATLSMIFSDYPEKTNSMNIPAEEVPFRFVTFGDQQSQEYKIPDLVAETEDAAFIMYTGDLVQEGNSLNDWSSFFRTKMDSIVENYLFQPVPGNHEEESPLYPAMTGKPFWYSYTWGNAYFLAIDNSAPYQEGSPQYEFIIESLEEARNYQYSFVYMHYPPYSTRKHHSDMPSREGLVPLFEQYDVDVVFCGHNHGYEATYPLFENEIDEENGVIYIVAAGGGAVLYDSLEFPEWLRIENKDYNYLRVSVSEDAALIEAIDLDGNIFDTIEILP